MRSRNMRMTRSLALVVATCLLLCLVRPTNCDVDVDSSKSAGNSQEPKTAHDVPTIHKTDVAKSDNKNTAAAAVPNVDTKTNPDKAVITSNEKPAVVKVQNVTAENSSKTPEHFGTGHSTSLNSGALMRGFYVFVGLSVLAMAYIVFRSFRLNKSTPQMVRKYGILAHKQDIEMRPLPLDEDDEDDTTVFDASGLSPQRSQS